MRAYVKGRELKRVFEEISYVYRSSKKTRTIGITMSHNSITFTVEAGIVYQSRLSIYNVKEPVDISVTIMFKDIKHFISAKEDVLLTVTDKMFVIQTQKAEISMLVGVSVISEYKTTGTALEKFDKNSFSQLVSLFGHATDLQKAFNKELMLSFYGDEVILFTPTIWVKKPYNGTSCVLSLSQMRIISAISPDSISVSERMEFKSEHSILSVPLTKPSVTNNFDNYCKDMTLKSIFNLDNVLDELNEIKRIVDASQATVVVYEHGFSVSIVKEDLTLKQSYGNLDKVALSFTMMFDLFVTVMTLLETDVKVYSQGGDLLCLQNAQGLSILVSV